mmetsp:Transcript_97639/g.271671  ORF Transcript_97639/g.271671 Transcript_97639/m.271671 type:complete len:100 (-) Transcript_97639:467-766(-)
MPMPIFASSWRNSASKVRLRTKLRRVPSASTAVGRGGSASAGRFLGPKSEAARAEAEGRRITSGGGSAARGSETGRTRAWANSAWDWRLRVDRAASMPT